MRKWIIAAGLIAAAFALSPSLWPLLGMRFGATPVTYIEANGARRDSLFGPAAPWPDWVPLPAGAKLRVESYFGAGTGYVATGMGSIVVTGSVEQRLAALTAASPAGQWRTSTFRFEGAEPTLPPRRFVGCTLVAVSATSPLRTVAYSFEARSGAGKVSIQWHDGPAPRAPAGVEGAC